MGVPRTLAEGLSKLKEAAQARKAVDVAGAMPYAGATAAALAGVTGSQEAEAGPLQTLGRAAPYLTSVALGGAAALQSQDAEAGKLKAGKEVIEALVRRAGDAGVPTGYRGGHTAPVSPEYHAPLHDMAKTYPDDIYSKDAPRFYGHGDPVMDKGSFDVINRVRGDENAPVTMYRAVPADAPNEINPGDWVTPNLEYAKLHGEGFDNYKILQGETVAGRLRTDGNSPHEFGYTGNATPALLAATAVGTGAGIAAADAFSAQPDPSYDAYIRDEMEARTAAESFAQMRGSKAGYWEARRQELLDMVTGLGEMANNVVLPALDKPLQGYLGLAGTAGALAQGQGLQQALMQGANIARQPSDQTTYNMGGAVTDTISPYTTPEAAAAAGALTNAGIQMLSPI